MSRWINIDDLPTSRVEWDDIFDAPSIDIVRCKECMWSSPTKYANGKLHCSWHYRSNMPDDFCSYGERAEQTEPQVDKDINVRSKDEPYIDIETGILHWCGWKYRRIYEDEPQRNMAEDIVESFGFKAESYRQAKAKDEPQTDCAWK